MKKDTTRYKEQWHKEGPNPPQNVYPQKSFVKAICRNTTQRMPMPLALSIYSILLFIPT